MTYMFQMFSKAFLLLATLAAGMAVADSGGTLPTRASAEVERWSAERLSELADALETLRDDGIDPEHFGLSAIRSGAAATSNRQADATCLARIADTALSEAVRALEHGLLPGSAADPLWRIDGIASAHRGSATNAGSRPIPGDIVASFEQARPSHAAYLTLRNAHAELRRLAGQEPDPLPAGPTLRTGMQDARVAVLRERLMWLGHALDDSDVPELFDIALEAAVRDFQHDHMLDPDGVVGRLTREALNLDGANRLERVHVNLERWRQLSDTLHERQLLVDVGAARVEYFENHEVKWSSRVQVGRQERPTPLLYSNIDRITLNPPWIVPPTILRRDKLPEIRANPQILERNHFRVLDRDGTELDPAEVDWYAPGPIQLRQDPGPLNALGQLAIRFANPFSVYLHDTPSQALFTSWQRTFSSGCVRVERALELSELLLAPALTPEHIARLLADGRTRELRLPEPVPILIAYFGASVSEHGHLQLRPDIYGHDAHIAQALAAEYTRRGTPECAITQDGTLQGAKTPPVAPRD